MSKRLDEWDKQVPASVLAKQQRLNARRRFLAACAGTAALPFVSAAPVDAIAGETPAWRVKEPWLTLAAVQEHLFPSNAEAPGARQINATQYLKNVIDHHDIEQSEKDFIQSGVKWLNGLAKEQFSLRFVELNTAAKESVLRKVAQSRAGENWLSTLLTYLIEALLTAPAYGGNTNGIGWRWLEHQPGFPQPPASKVYYRL
ncbi:gluconate 2-dehydrogenase subunit 3 family protein [Sulfuriflexus mobilis]|uniref:gluconate 2-dehydrogenase subunit 3 family protein n=1 Tax=Sulfuriflexus mobilis TaxID=1811807 RepID=UPI000F82ED99|nr:gluconate 2-dehydrogenase subunit 3 family protein [Sulfuriflexus mobilis]